MMHRLSLTLRALLLVPLMAVGIDQVRALALCGPDAQSCLEAAGRGWVGVELDRLGAPRRGPWSDRSLGGAGDRDVVVRHQWTPRIRYASAVASPEAFSLGSFLPLAAADSGNTLYAMCRIWSTAFGASA